MRQDVEEVQACGFHQPLGGSKGAAPALFVVSNRGFQGEEIEIFPLNGFLVSFWPRKKKRAAGAAQSLLYFIAKGKIRKQRPIRLH